MERPTKREIIEQLKLEREILSKGGYGRSPRTPRKAPQYFRDSVTCLNYEEVIRKHPCDECFLMDYVPDAHRDEDIPCHHIRLNNGGDSIASLEEGRDPTRVEQALLRWLDATIERLELEEAC